VGEASNRSCKPRSAQDIPEKISLLENDCDGVNGAASRMSTDLVTGRMLVVSAATH
jgi:hypothetical protein